MAGLTTNRSGEMEVFVRVVEHGSFSAAARTLRMTPSATSKLIARLEQRLGARLFNRSTRRLQLTPEGQSYYAHSSRILADIDEAEREFCAGSTPRGRLRVNANVPFGLHYLLPRVPEFLARYPGVELDLALSDQVIDLLEERADLAIRVGPMRASRLVARKLGSSGMAVVASPDYLRRRGTPRSLAELEAHDRIGFNFARSYEGWPFLDAGGIRCVPAVGSAQAGDGEVARQLALGGVGLARLGLFHIGPDLEAGRLVRVLEDLNPGDTEDIHAVFLGAGGLLPARVRALVDFLVETIRLP